MKIKKKIINFSLTNTSYNLKKWAIKNQFILNQKYSEYKEIYLPRLIYSFYLEEKNFTIFKIKKKMNIILNFYKGEVQHIKNKKTHNILSNKIFKN